VVVIGEEDAGGGDDADDEGNDIARHRCWTTDSKNSCSSANSNAMDRLRVEMVAGPKSEQ